MKEDQNEGFKLAVKALRRRKHSRLPRGYKKDPKEYRGTTLDENNNKER